VNIIFHNQCGYTHNTKINFHKPIDTCLLIALYYLHTKAKQPNKGNKMIVVYRDWQQTQETLHDKLIELGEMDSFSIQEETKVDGQYFVSWDFYLELFVKSEAAPKAYRYWAELENSDGDIELIEIVGGVPQYNTQSVLCSGTEIQKAINIV
jgi:hypothetical protein